MNVVTRGTRTTPKMTTAAGARMRNANCCSANTCRRGFNDAVLSLLSLPPGPRQRLALPASALSLVFLPRRHVLDPGLEVGGELAVVRQRRPVHQVVVLVLRDLDHLGAARNDVLVVIERLPDRQRVLRDTSSGSPWTPCTGCTATRPCPACCRRRWTGAGRRSPWRWPTLSDPGMRATPTSFDDLGLRGVLGAVVHVRPVQPEGRVTVAEGGQSRRPPRTPGSSDS